MAILSSASRSSWGMSLSSYATLALVLLFLLAPPALCDVDTLSCSDDDNNDGLPELSGSPACFPPDRRALLQFKASISSDPSHALSGWLPFPNSNCCEWNGVTCDATGRVIRLKLPDLNLKGAISPSLGALSALKVLLLQQNDFDGYLPSSLGNLVNLQRFCIFSNPTLAGSIPVSFGMLKNLQLLDLSSNALSGSLPFTIGGMSSLQHIRIYGNKIGGVIPDSFGRLSQLFNADLANNQLSGFIPDGFAEGLSSLAFLYLENNRITGLPANLRNLTRLQWVDLSNNPLASSDAVAGLATAPLIAQIELASCGLSGPFPTWVSQLPHPDVSLLSDEVTPSIDLSNNAISGPIPWAVGDLTFLQSLSLDGNKLTGRIPGSFRKLQSLKYFNVTNNQLSGQIPQVAPLTTFAVSAYRPGNPGLCGKPLRPCRM